MTGPTERWKYNVHKNTYKNLIQSTQVLYKQRDRKNIYFITHSGLYQHPSAVHFNKVPRVPTLIKLDYIVLSSPGAHSSLLEGACCNVRNNLVITYNLINKVLELVWLLGGRVIRLYKVP